MKFEAVDNKTTASRADNRPAAVTANSIIQPKLEIGSPGDHYEKEADAVAEKVTRMPEQSFVQRKCAHCEEEDKKHVQRKPLSEPITPFVQAKSEGGHNISNTLNNKISSSSGNGSSLDTATLSFMNNRFGNDFKDVRIHTSPEAIQMNRELNAKAFTVGKDIYFNKEQYQPGSGEGKKLLAHELTHVVQQSGSKQLVQRACSAEDQTEYDTIAEKIKTLPHYLKAPKHDDAIYTPKEVKEKADDIIKKARDRDECLYYIRNLEKLFSTDEEPPGKVGEEFKKRLAEGAAAETERLKDPGASADAGVEESGVDPEVTGRKLKGQEDKIYYVDSSDINNIFVKAKIKLKGKKEFTDQVKQMEDGIEKAGSISGYTINVIFTEKSGKDVFETEVDPTKWPTSGNWVGGIDALVHELHHMLNLPDRYNYIDAHSGNKKMYIANRIHWFTEEFNRAEDPNIRNSFMGKGELVMPEDICKVVNPADAAAEADCITKRRLLNEPALTIKMNAFARTQRLIEVLEGFIPPTLLDARADDKTISSSQEIILRTAEQIFGYAPDKDSLSMGLNRIRNFLVGSRVQLENSSDPRCVAEHVGLNRLPNAFLVCPTFFGLSKESQVHELIRSAYRMYQEFSAEQQYEKMMGRGESVEEAKKWADFITKAYNRI